VTAPVSVTLSSSQPARTAFDTTIVTIAAGSSSVNAGAVFDTAGTYVITANAAGYGAANATTTVNGAVVSMVSIPAFSPASVAIRAGQYVTWRNDDQIVHTTTADAGAWNVSLNPGVTHAQYFSAAGTFSYHCNVHAGMTGTVVVNP
jgi:plastocyanin